MADEQTASTAAEDHSDQPSVTAGIAPALTRLATSRWMPLGLFLSAFALRVVNIGLLRFALDDIPIIAATGPLYVRYGFTGPDNWFTQPGVHYVTWLSISLFGNDPIGWRMRSALFGALAVLTTFLLARRVFRTAFVPLAAAVLVALDPVSLSFSRNVIQDVVVAALLPAAILLFLRALDDDRNTDWIGAGLCLGLAGATRWYALLPAFVMALVAITMRRRDLASTLSRLVGSLVLIPAIVYAASYLPWSSRGYSVAEWIAMQLDALRYQTGGLENYFSSGIMVLSGPRQWFTSWVGSIMRGPVPHSYSLQINDPVLWWSFLPAVAYLVWRGVRRHAAGPIVIGGSFILIYLLFATTTRPIFLYSSLALVPLGFIATAFAIERFLQRYEWILLSVAVAWCVYLYPLTSGLPVPEGPYAWIVARILQ